MTNLLNIPLNILVAEDDANIRAGLVDTLESEGYEVTEAADGEEALFRFRQRTPDLVLLDVMMPGKSGFEILHELRGDPVFEGLPVLMLTARGQAKDREMAEMAGVSKFMTKPFSNAEMLDAVAQLISKLYIVCSDCRYSLGVHRIEIKGDAEGYSRKNRELVRSVDPLNIEGRVCFCIPKLLCFTKYVIERTVAAFARHLGENEVCGPVDNACYPLDSVASEATADIYGRLAHLKSPANGSSAAVTPSPASEEAARDV